MSNHGNAKDFYLLRSENILKKLDDLEEANDCLRIRISAREEVCNRLESNWNKLKECLKDVMNNCDADDKNFVETILDIMQELEQKGDVK